MRARFRGKAPGAIRHFDRNDIVRIEGHKGIAPHRDDKRAVRDRDLRKSSATGEMHLRDMQIGTGLRLIEELLR